MSNKRYVDYRQLKDQVSLLMVLDHYDLTGELKKRGEELHGKCPLHQGEGNRSFHANVGKNAFHCFSCNKKGNILDFVAAKEGCSVREASVLIADWFQVEDAGTVPKTATDKSTQPTEKASQIPDKPKPRINPENCNKPLAFMLRVDSDHRYGADRGLSRESIQSFGTGLCVSKGMFIGRYLIPIHNDLGQLVAYAGRSLNEEDAPKYLFPPPEKGFFKTELLFNLHRVPISTAGSNLVYVVEGFFAAMRLHQAGLPCVGLMGASLSFTQEELLAQKFDRLVLVFDGDSAGRRCTDECLRRLSKRRFVFAHELSDGEQPDSFSSDEEVIRRFSIL